MRNIYRLSLVDEDTMTGLGTVTGHSIESVMEQAHKIKEPTATCKLCGAYLYGESEFCPAFCEQAYDERA